MKNKKLFFNNKYFSIKYKKFDLLVLLIILFLCLGFTNKIFQNDTFYSIPIGRDILKYGVDMIDHYSIHNISYTYPHWLFDICVYLIYSFGGFNYLYYFSIFIYFIIGFLLYFLTVYLFKNRFISAFFSISAIISLSSFITVRAQILTYILFILELFFIEEFLSSSNKKVLLSFPIISILIVNLHCAVWPFFFLLFLPYICEYLLFLFKNKQIKFFKFIKPSGKFLPFKTSLNIFNEKISLVFNENAKYLIFIFIVCLFTGFVCLNGFTPYIYSYKTYQGNTTSWISEHLPAILNNNPYLLYYLLIYLFVFIFLKIKVKFCDFILSLGLFILAFSSFRHLSLLIICSIFPLSRIFSNYFASINKYLDKTFVKIFTSNFVFIISLILAFLLSFSNYYSKKIFNQSYVEKSLYPVDAVNYIIDNLDINNIRLFNEYNYGSYLVFKDIPVFIDSRADLYTSEFNNLDRSITDDYLNYQLNYNEIFDYYRITHIIVYKYSYDFNTSIFYKLLDLDLNFEIIYEDKYFSIFERLEN